jgi:hypothetical protein
MGLCDISAICMIPKAIEAHQKWKEIICITNNLFPLFLLQAFFLIFSPIIWHLSTKTLVIGQH